MLLTRLVSSIFHLEATTDHYLYHFLEDHPDINSDIINKIKHSLYLDDLSNAAEKLKDASELYIQSQLIFEKANMNLRKWKSSSNEFMMFIKKHENGKRLEVLEEPSYADSSLNPSLVDDKKVLGIPWNTSRDTFIFTMQHPLHDIRPEHITKRQFLQFSASVFDLLSILSPAMLPLKVMFQQLFKEGKDWEKDLPTKSSAKFQQWLSKATKVPKIEIERCYTKNKEIKESLLAGFCDASKIGYAACIYVCAKYADESASVKMIAAKTRVAPLTNQSIPRLELLGALVLSRLMKTGKTALQQFTIILQIHSGPHMDENYR